MNNERRKKLSDLSDKIEELKTEAENLLEEEQEYYDNMPENLQNSEKGEKSENAIGEIEYIIQCR